MGERDASNAAISLSDALAVGRTRLANERTLLAYWRTALALGIAGASIINFADTAWFQTFGLLCLPTGVVVAYVGWRRFKRMNRHIANWRTGIDR